eukprot:scaffold2740_cov418-Prasinococcus_capsulatus_cf.AAC.21
MRCAGGCTRSQRATPRRCEGGGDGDGKGVGRHVRPPFSRSEASVSRAPVVMACDYGCRSRGGTTPAN